MFSFNSNKNNNNNNNEQKHKDGKLYIKGHKFVGLKYRMPTYCDACNKPLWDIFNPPLAIECQCKCGLDLELA